MASLEALDSDITTLEVDAIANAANAQMLHGGGVAAAIVLAGGSAIDAESRAQAPVPRPTAFGRVCPGEAIATSGGDMPCRWVIHAVTMVQPAGSTSADVIRRCTAATLAKADELGARSLALVAFGAGVGGFPLDEVARIEADEVRRHLTAGSGLERVVFCVRGPEAKAAFESALTAT